MKRADRLVSGDLTADAAVDASLTLLLDALHRMSAPIDDEDFAAGAAQFAEVIEQTRALPHERQAGLLDEFGEVVDEAERSALRTAAEFELSRRAMHALQKVLGSNGAAPDEVEATTETSTGPRKNAVTEAPDTDAAIFVVMERRPTHEWSPQEVKEAFLRAGRHATDSMIQSAMKRLAFPKREIKKTRHGRYRLWQPGEEPDEE